MINDGPTTESVSSGADATLVSWQGNNATENIGKTLFIFAYNNVVDSTTNAPIASNFCSARLYWMKIWQDNVLVRDYIPVVSNGEAGLYDKVNKTTIFNAGPSDTSFTYG